MQNNNYIISPGLRLTSEPDDDVDDDDGDDAARFFDVFSVDFKIKLVDIELFEKFISTSLSLFSTLMTSSCLDSSTSMSSLSVVRKK